MTLARSDPMQSGGVNRPPFLDYRFEPREGCAEDDDTVRTNCEKAGRHLNRPSNFRCWYQRDNSGCRSHVSFYPKPPFIYIYRGPHVRGGRARTMGANTEAGSHAQSSRVSPSRTLTRSRDGTMATVWPS